MYETLSSPIPDAPAYAERIHLNWPLKPDVETLDKIVFQNQCCIPFENLNVINDRKIPSLEIEDLFQKVVKENRGGYCFEINKLLCSFLLSVGYPAYPVLCRIMWKKDAVPALLHEAVLAECDGTLYYCDVGYGGPQPGGCLPLIDGNERTICGFTYRTEKLDEHWWQISLKMPGKPFAPMIQFLPTAMTPSAFVPLNHYCATYTDFYFYQNLVVNLRTKNGNLSLKNMEFTEITPDTKSTRTLTSKKELSQILSEKFHINCDCSCIELPM